MKKILIIILFAFFISGLVFAQKQEKKIGTKVRTKTKKTNSSKEKKLIDLEGLEIQGLIDSPQTLYILKGSKVDFSDVIDDYDYVKVIIDTTYKAPF